MSKSLLPLAGVGLAALLTGGAAASCSASRNSSGFTSSNNGGGGSGSSQHGGTGAGMGSGMGGDVNFTTSNSNSGSTGSLGPDGGCAGTATKAQQLPLDMYIMLDQSGSMDDATSAGPTKWQAVTQALESFLSQPGLAGISVGIQYFGVPPGGSVTCNVIDCYLDSDCGNTACGPCEFADPIDMFPGFCNGALAGGDSCAPADYAKPDVEIAALPSAAGPLMASIGAHMPNTSTPTGPALQGAEDHAKAWAMSHPGHVVIAVLATDGQPNECAPTDTQGLQAIAAQALGGTPSVKTFTIGIFEQADFPSGPALLDAIAASGGTQQGFNINTQTNVNQAFLDALNKIRGTALGCNYSIPVPQNGTPDFTAVNVQYTPGGGGMPEIIPQVADKAHCPASGDAWYYDNPSAPTQILICASTCNKLGMDSTGEVDVVLGCKTIVK